MLVPRMASPMFPVTISKFQGSHGGLPLIHLETNFIQNVRRESSFIILLVDIFPRPFFSDEKE